MSFETKAVYVRDVGFKIDDLNKEINQGWEILHMCAASGNGVYDYRFLVILRRAMKE